MLNQFSCVCVKGFSGKIVFDSCKFLGYVFQFVFLISIGKLKMFLEN